MVAQSADIAFELMADGVKQGQWAWGSADRVEVNPGLFKGHSIFSGKQCYVRLHLDRPRFVVDYEVGPSPEAMQFHNTTRVIPGSVLKIDPNHCVITLLSWRNSKQSDADWEQLCCVHEAEMFLIRGLLERR
jgi:hypothetical protein